jgi:hypothetical protein
VCKNNLAVSERSHPQTPARSHLTTSQKLRYKRPSRNCTTGCFDICTNCSSWAVGWVDARKPNIYFQIYHFAMTKKVALPELGW